MRLHFPRTITRRSPGWAAALLAGALCVASCGHKTPPAPDFPPPVAPASPGITFGRGFHLAEVLNPTAAVRWAHQDAELRVEAPGDGCYRLTFLPFTVFTMAETPVEISVNGRPAGEFSTRAFDVAEAVPTPVEVELRAGVNELRLHARQTDLRLGENDERLAAFGLRLPVSLERVP